MRLLFEIDMKDYDPGGKAFRRPSARGIIFRGGRISVIYSRKRGFCKLPGGGIEAGEDNVSALIREVREETGMTVKPETVREFGYVHRIQKGDPDPVFIQDNYYYFCEVEDTLDEPELTPEELGEDFVPMFTELRDAIAINEEFESRGHDVMVERELRVLRLIADCTRRA